MAIKKPVLKNGKTPALRAVEFGFLCLFLGVMALRATFTESPGGVGGTQHINIFTSIYSLSFSLALLLGVCVWVIFNFTSARPRWRLTGWEVPIILFVIAAIAAGAGAADKRAAITSFAVLIVPLMAALALVQVLDRPARVTAALVVITGLGVMATYQYIEQFWITGEETVAQYEADPEEFLQPLEITPGTFHHLLFEHRLYSRGVRGSFTTANSAGSFSILATFAALAVFTGILHKRKSGNDESQRRFPLLPAFALGLCALGIVLTQSKGAIGAAAIAAVMFGAWCLFHSWIGRHKKLLVVLTVLVVIAGTIFVIYYGSAHGTLPGGKSMLIRWQYWQSSLRMYADNPVTGVGPANFKYYYPAYKIPEAVETVTDPHNFPLSMLTQYGPLGLAAMLGVVILPLAALARKRQPVKTEQSGADMRFIIYPAMGIIILALLVLRPLLIPMTTDMTAPAWVTMYIGFAVYIIPVLIFALGVLLFSLDNRTAQSERFSPARAALFCGVIGFFIHSLLDFAIFEPSVYTAFMAILACILAIDFDTAKRTTLNLPSFLSVKMPAIVLAVVMPAGYLFYVFVPPTRSMTKLDRAYTAFDDGRFDYAHRLTGQAVELDLIDPAAPTVAARLYLMDYHRKDAKDESLLRKTEDNLLTAISRNPKNFRYYENLSDVYVYLAENAEDEQKDFYLRQAIRAAQQAVERYPGSERLRFSFAQIAERLGKEQLALEQYQKVVEIEEAFRDFFPRIFPEHDFVSRLGSSKYEITQRKIEEMK